MIVIKFKFNEPNITFFESMDKFVEHYEEELVKHFGFTKLKGRNDNYIYYLKGSNDFLYINKWVSDFFGSFVRQPIIDNISMYSLPDEYIDKDFAKFYELF